MTYICVSKLTIIGPDNGLSPGRCQAIIWTNTGILIIGPLGTNFSENLSGIQTFSFKKMPLKMSSGKLAAILSRPQCVNPVAQIWYNTRLAIFFPTPWLDLIMSEHNALFCPWREQTNGLYLKRGFLKECLLGTYPENNVCLPKVDPTYLTLLSGSISCLNNVGSLLSVCCKRYFGTQYTVVPLRRG